MIQHRVAVIEPNGTVTSKAYNNVEGATTGHYVHKTLVEVERARSVGNQPITTLTIHYSQEDL